MNGIDYLIDTNILIYILQGDTQVRYFAQSEVLSISCITEMEVLGKYHISEPEKDIIIRVLDNCYIIELDHQVKTLVTNIKQQVRVKLPDAIIAATAIRHGLPLVTADKGFKNIPGLELLVVDLI
jgi:predicted nucleic acid-binding protein